MFKPYLKAIVRADSGGGWPGLGIELFRLDAAEEAELTAEELEEAEEAKEEASGTALMRVYEEIGEDFGGGVTAKKFAEELDGFGDNIKRLHIHINLLGGDVFAAQAIHSAIKNHKAKTTAYIDGVAASAATIVACGAGEVVARLNSTYMIHQPWGFCMGNADEMEKSAANLRAITKPIVNVYKGQVGDKIDEEKISRLMEDETWMDAEEALEYGFVDRIKGKIKAIAKLNRSQILCSGQLMDLGRYHYRNVPKFPTLKADARKAAEAQLKPNKEAAMEAEKPKLIMKRDEITPELVAAIEAEARTAERARLAALDAMVAPGIEEIIAKAKADGSQPDAIAMQCFNVTRQQLVAVKTASALARDAAQAGGLRPGDAPPSPAPVDQKQQAQKQAAGLIVNALKTVRPSGVPARPLAN